MTRNKVVEILKSKSLEVTKTRVEVLYFLFKNGNRLIGLSEISGLHDNQLGRITIYRTLLTLCTAGLIYKIIDTNNKPYYAVLKNLGPYSNQLRLYSKECYHFKCISCGSIVCLLDSSKDIQLPQGFVKTGANLLLTGYCAKCSKKARKSTINKSHG